MSLARSKLSPLEALGLGGEKHARDATRRKLADSAVRWLRDAAGRLAGGLRRRPRALALELDLPERTVRFRSVTEFEFALSSKTEYPVAKVEGLVHRPPSDLRKIATHIRGVEKRFAQVLTDSMRESGLVGELMREVEIKLFSQDHGWRDLVESLNLCGREFDEYKRIALVKYMQYLGSRQDVLRSIYLDKVRGVAALPEAPATVLGANPNETAMFDVRADALAGGSSECYTTLPRGETVSVHLEPGQALDLELSGHPFRLYGGREHYLIDENGEQHPLRAGKNVVGRQVDGDVVVDGRLRAVSRRHLVIETIDENTVLLTDVSAHGTSMLQGFAGN